jgi:hypothetical protein
MSNFYKGVSQISVITMLQNPTNPRAHEKIYLTPSISHILLYFNGYYLIIYKYSYFCLQPYLYILYIILMLWKPRI